MYLWVGMIKHQALQLDDDRVMVFGGTQAGYSPNTDVRVLSRSNPANPGKGQRTPNVHTIRGFPCIYHFQTGPTWPQFASEVG